MDSNEYKPKFSIPAAVIVLHVQESDALILTKRTENLRAHPGEVCFPGGSWEEGDQSLYDTGLRELQEELGVNPDRVSLIKELETQRTRLGSIIHPWFARIETIEPYVLNPNEVARLITIPMSLVQNKKHYKQIIVEHGGHRFKSWEFIYNGDSIWGATAKIMRQLIVSSK